MHVDKNTRLCLLILLILDTVSGVIRTSAVYYILYAEGWTLFVHERRKDHCFLLLSRQAYIAIYAGSRLLSLYCTRLNVYNVFIAAEMQLYVHVLFITKLSQFSSKKHVASHVPVRKSLPDIKQACSVLMHVRAFIAAKSVVYVFKTQRTPNSVVFLFQVR
jgi:hypothetical protein